jgi:hypothetical protein
VWGKCRFVGASIKKIVDDEARTQKAQRDKKSTKFEETAAKRTFPGQ